MSKREMDWPAWLKPILPTKLLERSETFFSTLCNILPFCSFLKMYPDQHVLLISLGQLYACLNEEVQSYLIFSLLS